MQRCVGSILAQTFSDFELILVDDGSPDRCGPLCDDFARQDARVCALHQPNGGVSSARNAGIDRAQAELILFVDADDQLSDAHVLATLHSQMGSDVCDIYQFQTYVQRGGQPTVLKTLPATGPISISQYARLRLFRGEVWNFVFRRSFLNAHAVRFLQGVRVSEDQAFVYACMAHAHTIKLLAGGGDFVLPRHGEFLGQTLGAVA